MELLNVSCSNHHLQELQTQRWNFRGEHICLHAQIVGKMPIIIVHQKYFCGIWCMVGRGEIMQLYPEGGLYLVNKLKY